MDEFLISYRQTQKGDWLIFHAVPYTQGIGVNQVGTPGNGYTTGHQYGRADSEKEAERSAQALVAENSTPYCKWVIVPWVPPYPPNPQFEGLSKKHPLKTEYTSLEDAESDGWIYINPSKIVAIYRERTIRCQDITPGRSFGESFAIQIKGEAINFAKSSVIWIDDKFSARFRTGEVVDAIQSAKKWINQDLITLTEAAQIMAALSGNKPHAQTIRNAVFNETLDSWDNPEGKSRQGRILVSRAQVEKVWGPKGD